MKLAFGEALGLEESKPQKPLRKIDWTKVWTKTIWVTREGERIPVRKLGDTHLQNIIRMLRRAGRYWHAAEISDAYGFLSFLNGEMAIWTLEEEINQLEAMDVDEFLSKMVPTWDALLNEAYRRKLEVPK